MKLNINVDVLYLIFLPQDVNIVDTLVPRVRQTFETKEEAHEFYRAYAKIAGFNLRTARTSKETAHWVCSRQGHHKSDKENEEAQTAKTSARIGCVAFAKVKEDKKRKLWYFDHVEEAHNHSLHPSPSLTAYMHAHKHMEAAMNDIFAIMSRSGVPHHAAMNVMAELYGGRKNWPFTEKDIKNM